MSISVLSDVYDILTNKRHVHDELKAALIKRFTKSERECITQVLSPKALGDRMPSVLPRRKQVLVIDNSIDTILFRQIFLQMLPCQAREIP